MAYQTTYLWLALVFGLLMAWGIGANDVSNAMGTSVGSRAITIRQAIVIAAIFEFLGAFLAGGEVTQTLSQSIVHPDTFSQHPTMFIHGMLASLLSSALWLLIATHYGWPVSTTHSIVGAIVGFGAYHGAHSAVDWSQVLSIGASWVTSPLLGGIIAFSLFTSIQKTIFDRPDPIIQAQKMVPVYMALVGWIVVMITLKQGLKSMDIVLSANACGIYATIASLFLFGIGRYLTQRLHFDPKLDEHFHFANVEKVFSLLMLFTGSAMAFAHGSNDVANAIGPVSAIVTMIQGKPLGISSAVPVWILLLGATGIVVGLATYGHKVIATIGTGITHLTPSRGFAATLAAAATVVLASGTGMPVSTTHTLVGAILGVGLARGISALNLKVILNIFMSWIITLPAGALLAVLFCGLFDFLFG